MIALILVLSTTLSGVYATAGKTLIATFSSHLSRMDCPTLISRTRPFPILGVLVLMFFFVFRILSYLNQLIGHTVCKQ